MKKILIGICAIVICLAVTGCGKNNGKLLLNCNSEESEVKVKKDNTFKCKFLNEEYKFTITKIEDNKITIKASDTGLTSVSEEGTINLLEKKTEFTIKKDKELIIEPQITDGGFEMLTINWKK